MTSRQPAGQPSGGQFATHTRGDSTVALLPHPMPEVGQEVIYGGTVRYVERVDGGTAMLRNLDGDLELASERDLDLHNGPALTRDRLIEAAIDSATAESESTGSSVAGTISLVTVDGTAASDATLCVDHFGPVEIDDIGREAAADLQPLRWAPSSGNTDTKCSICGAGYGTSEYERNEQLIAELPAGIVGYTYSAEQFTAQDLMDHWGIEVADMDEHLDAEALTRGIDRKDLHSFDSDDFPKPIYRDQLDPSEDLTWLGGADGSAER